jgi:hypothetical protein
MLVQSPFVNLWVKCNCQSEAPTPRSVSYRQNSTQFIMIWEDTGHGFSDQIVFLSIALRAFFPHALIT